jgi:hypothetical protein
MVPIDRDALRAVEVALAAAVLGIVTLIALQQPLPWPSWPTVGGLAVDPELWIPGLLAVAALLGVVEDGLGFGTAVVGVLAVPTLLLAASSVYALTAGTAGGVFAGGLFTLAAATVLAVGILIRAAVRVERRRAAAGDSQAA